MTVTALPAQPVVNARLLFRNSVTRLTPRQLADLRSAYAAVKQITDERGFDYWAGIHGLPLPISCEHHTALFLPWHRAYLYFFELALQDQMPGVTQPWWDWTARAAHRHGIPAASAAQTSNGQANPLASSTIPPAARVDPQGGGTAPAATFRDPGDPAQLPVPAAITQLLDLGDFLDFQTQLENVHDFIHVWIGGTTAEIPWAALDPLFWAHHAMIDRLWRLWQLRHPQAGLPPELLGQALRPFAMTVAQALNVTALGYDYASFPTRMPANG